MFYPNVVISKWTTRKGAGGQTEREYVNRCGRQYQCNYFNKESNVVPSKHRFKPMSRKNKVLPSCYSLGSVTAQGTAKKPAAMAAKGKGKGKAASGAKGKEVMLGDQDKASEIVEGSGGIGNEVDDAAQKI